MASRVPHHAPRTGRLLTLVTGVALACSAVGLTPAATATATADAARPSGGSFLVVARDASRLPALRKEVADRGGRVVDVVPGLNLLEVRGDAALRASLAADSAVTGIGTNEVRTIAIADPANLGPHAPGLRSAQTVAVPKAASGTTAAGVRPDPGFHVQGLQWDYGRMGLPSGWGTTAGDPAVTVGVADTGLDFTHRELASQVAQVQDFSDPSICKDQFTFGGKHVSDADLARTYGGPATGDWNGHGSWIGGNIAAALNGTGINGIAPNVRLVALKIAGWCGAAADVQIIKAFLYAADHGIDVVNISFGGYADRSQPAQDVTYGLYAAAVQHARARGTVIAAAAGNEAVRVGDGGRVLSHGMLTIPGQEVRDPYGLFYLPGGLPGVVDVSATNNRVVAASSTCLPSKLGTPTSPDATCKPTSDPHQATGVGRTDQLSYYSNYGPRIDVAAPGGARKFNLPASDRGGTPGFPVTSDDLTNVWQDFSITSNWAVEIPCYTFTVGSAFPPKQCYTSIQGTSMAAPHAAAALALIASAKPSLRHDVPALVAQLKSQAVDRVNYTRAVSATDTSPGDLSGVPCATGYCHLGGDRIPNREAYGAGLVMVSRP
ncbi:MAG: S8 family serine peptidase [Actinomycetes bacterium]